MDKYCSKCHSPNSANSDFCTNCGSRLNNFCPNCHNRLNESSSFCPYCGYRFSGNQQIFSGNTDNFYDYNASAAENIGRDFDVHHPPAELKSWNMGAFVFTFIWGLFNRVYISLISLALWIIQCLFGENTAVSVSCMILLLAFSIYLGIYGNSLAYKGGKFKTLEDCLTCQLGWSRWGSTIVFILIAALIKGLARILFKH